VEKANTPLLIFGLIRPILWIVGGALAYSYRNWFALIGCILSSFTSIPIAFRLAGFMAPHWMLSTATLVATPAVMFIVAGIAYSARNHRILKQWADDVAHRFER
jgi:hypothetical protein